MSNLFQISVIKTCLFIIIFFTALGTPQNQKFSSKGEVMIDNQDNVPVRKIIPENISAPLNAENYTAVALMANAFGPAIAVINPLAYDPYSDVVAMVHRGHSSYGSGGQLYYTYSTNKGATWQRIGPVRDGAARYPSMAISNPSGAGINGTTALFSWPELTPAAFGLVGYGADQPVGGDAAFNVIDQGPPAYSSQVPCWTSDNSEWMFWSSDNQENNDIEVWRTTDFTNVSSVVISGEPFGAGGNITLGGAGIGPVQYLGVIGTYDHPDTTNPINFGWYPVFFKSTDNGATWDQGTVVDFRTIPALSAYDQLMDYDERYNIIRFDGDINIDKYGHLHLALGITDTNTSPWTHSLVDVFQTATGWDATIIANLQGNPEQMYNAGPGLGQMGYSIYLAFDKNREVMAAQWVDAGVDGWADIYFSFKELESTAWAAPRNLTESPQNNTQSHLAPRLASSGNNFTAFSMYGYVQGVTGPFSDTILTTVVYIAPVHFPSNSSPTAVINADPVWLDSDYNGVQAGQVDGSGSTGIITKYDWYVNGIFAATGVSPDIQLNTGTNLVKLIVESSDGLSGSDSMYISVYSAKRATGGSILSGVSQLGNNFYVASMNKGVYRIDSTGSILQSYITDGSIQSALSICNQTNLMYVGSSNTRLYCFDTGLNSIWDKGLGGVVDNSAAINSGGQSVYVGANDHNVNLGFLKAMNANNGNPKWTFQADGTILSSPVVIEVLDSANSEVRTIIYFGTNKGTIYAVDDLGSSYSLFWSKSLAPDSAVVSSPAVSAEGMIYVGSKNGYLYRFNWDGYDLPTWRKYTGGPITSSPIIDENEIVYIASGSGYLYGYNKYFVSSSSPVKEFFQSEGINGTAALGPGGTLLIGCNNGKLFSLDKNSGGKNMPVNWYFNSTGSIHAPAMISENGIVFIGTTTGDIFIMKDPGTGRNLSSVYEWPTFRGDNLRSKVVKINNALTSVYNDAGTITSYELYQNYPNPFNPSTKIKYQLPVSGYVSIKLYDVIGNEISEIIGEEKDRGIYEINFDARHLPSGIYFYQFRSGSITETKKMIILK